MVSGSVAAIEFGEPRLTLDIDIALFLDVEEIPRLPEIFPEKDYYLPPLDVVALEITRPTRGRFNAIHHETGLKADFYPSRNHPMLAWAMQNRRRLSIGATEVWFAPPEYVILWKLEFLRESGGDKHARDIRGMLAVSGGEIDKALIEQWSARLGVRQLWDEVTKPRVNH